MSSNYLLPGKKGRRERGKNGWVEDEVGRGKCRDKIGYNKTGKKSGISIDYEDDG